MENLKRIEEELGIRFRWSVESDKDEIEALIGKRFGNRNSFGVLDNLDGRYFMAVNLYDEIIAITGLINSNMYNAPEIDWTCIKPGYTGHNLMSYMIEYVIKDYDGQIYCSCWRLKDKCINLRSAMAHNGFRPALIPRLTINSKFYATCGRGNCENYDPVDGVCQCHEDLYIRPKKEQ